MSITVDLDNGVPGRVITEVEPRLGLASEFHSGATCALKTEGVAGSAAAVDLILRSFLGKEYKW